MPVRPSLRGVDSAVRRLSVCLDGRGTRHHRPAIRTIKILVAAPADLAAAIQILLEPVSKITP